MASRTFVLVHGAWHGGWCWKRVAALLRAKGHLVYTPTLTGVADRAHLLSPTVGLATHIDDIVRLIRWEELSDVVLVGHSYAGLVISGVVEELETTIGSLVFLDAFVPEDGQGLVDIFAGGERIRSAAAGGATTVPPIPASVFYVNGADAEWVDRMSTAQPIRTFIDPVRLTGARERVPRRSYILSLVSDGATFAQFHARLAQDSAWRTFEIPCGHVSMLDMPRELADLLEAA